MTTPVLEVRELSVDYVTVGVVNHAVNNVSFHVDPGEVIGVVGESGCGKSTVILAALALTRHGGHIVSGSVKLNDEELLRLPDERLRKIRGAQIGLITQDPRGSLNPVMKIGAQIRAIYRAHQEMASEEEVDDRALELLRMVGINDPERRLDAYPHELSGGMAQRALIAMALSCRPRLVLADEPTSGLDVTVQAQVLDDLREAIDEVGSSMVLVTQDLGLVANYCDRVYLMSAGEVVEEAPTELFFERPSHPASAALLVAQRGLIADAFKLRGFPIDGRRLPSGCYLHPRCPFADESSGCLTKHPELSEIRPRHASRCHRSAAVVAAVEERLRGRPRLDDDQALAEEPR